MAFGFVHLSDIHFGQEGETGALDVNKDARERLIDDVKSVVTQLAAGKAAGIIVTGDIAYSGTEKEYDDASAWLDRLAKAAGCPITEIQVVPGNHDIDRDKITPAVQRAIDDIVEKGQPALDAYMADPDSRKLLFKRFDAFLPFAEGYRCPLDTSGQLAEERVVKLAEGRMIRFVRLNSALACSSKDKEGKLILGQRQHVLGERSGEELVVLIHHPIHWLQDSEESMRYIRSRARVVISGHEHNPAVRVETVEEGCQLMMLAAGATVPPHAGEKYTYCYNVIELDWDEASDSLSVRILPRAWNNERKRFEADDKRLQGNEPNFLLASPKFRSAPRAPSYTPQPTSTPSPAESIAIEAPSAVSVPVEGQDAPDSYSLMVLRFFRDLSPNERLKILIKMGILPAGFVGDLYESFERQSFDQLIRGGRGQELSQELQGLLAK